MLKLSKEKMNELVRENLITEDQSQKIWMYLSKSNEQTASYNLTHFFYYFGGLICILAMTWFMNLGWEQFGGAGLTLISGAYMIAFTIAGRKLWERDEFRIPAGILLVIAVCMTPLLVYGLQRWSGFWVQVDPGAYRDYHIWIKGSWTLMSLATVAVGGLFLRKYSFTFLTMPISVGLYYLTMDIVPLLYPDERFPWDIQKIYSVWFGLLMLIFSYFLDRKEKVDYSFWLYIFGLMNFWGGLTSMNSDSELGKFVYLLINLGLLFLALYLYRKVFMVFGVIGSMIYFFHLANKVFKDSLLFPFAMTLLGLAVMYIGIRYQKNRDRIDRKFTEMLPSSLKKLRPIERS